MEGSVLQRGTEGWPWLCRLRSQVPADGVHRSGGGINDGVNVVEVLINLSFHGRPVILGLHQFVEGFPGIRPTGNAMLEIQQAHLHIAKGVFAPGNLLGVDGGVTEPNVFDIPHEPLKGLGQHL